MGVIAIRNVRCRFVGFDEGQKFCQKGISLCALLFLQLRIFLLLLVV
jgi:hypothetical protein